MLLMITVVYLLLMMIIMRGPRLSVSLYVRELVRVERSICMCAREAVGSSLVLRSQIAVGR